MNCKGGDEEKFKLVVEANAVLSDPNRRARYDMGDDEDGLNDGFSGPGMGPGAMNVDLSELFAQFHGNSAFGGAGGGGSGFSTFGGGGGTSPGSGFNHHSFGGGTSFGGSGFSSSGRSRGFSQGFSY